MPGRTSQRVAFAAASLVLFLTATLGAQMPERGFGSIIDERLALPKWESSQPLGTVGETVWAAHPSGWAFADAVHLYRLCGAEGPRFDLKIRGPSGEITPASGSYRPSRVVQTASADGVIITTTKSITAKDVLCVELRLESGGRTAVEVDLETAYPFGGEADGELVRGTLVMPDLRRVYLAKAPGFAPVSVEPDPYAGAWHEGEAAVAQRGSTGPDRKDGASRGAVLGSDFGGKNDHRAAWDVEIGTDGEFTLVVRYARAPEAPAAWVAAVDGHELPGRLECPNSGGWGSHEREFGWARLELGPMDAGKHRLELRSTGDDNNTNIDGFYVLEKSRAASLPTPIPVPKPRTTRLHRRVTVAPGAPIDLGLCLAVGRTTEQAAERLAEVDAFRARTGHGPRGEDLIGWFDENVPAFTCEDELLNRMYAHRWYLLRKNLMKVGDGALSDWAFAEGRWNTTWYPNVISYGAGHQAREARWLRDPRVAEGFIRTWAKNKKKDGVFPSHITPAGPAGGQYTDWITAAAWEVFKCTNDQPFLAEVIDSLADNVRGWYRTYDRDGDGLLLVDSHWWTGMEFQPSFFAFADFDPDKDHHLERVDLTAYAVGSAKALAEAYAHLGRKAESKEFVDLTKRSWNAMVTTMWDPEQSFFYSVHPDDGRKSPVKEVIGTYPFYFGLPPVGRGFEKLWTSILDPEQFWAPWPVTSCTMKTPAYSQDGWVVKKKFSMACMWNGPTWPHANSLVLSAMGETLRRYPDSPLTKEKMFELFTSFTKAQMVDDRPWTGEFYRSDDARWKTAERDYFHSSWIDVLISDLIGIRPRVDDVLQVTPLLPPGALGKWTLENVRYHGRTIDLGFDGTKFRVTVDGVVIHESPEIQPFEKPFPRRAR